jgi:hypothetical protein
LDNRPSPRVEFFSGLGWIALGSAIVYGSWTMDRLENLNINPYTAPGLVPGVLGAVIALCGSIMAVRAGTFGSDHAAATHTSIFNWRVALSIALCLGFALGWLVAGCRSGLLRPSSFFSMSSCSASLTSAAGSAGCGAVFSSRSLSAPAQASR